MENRRAEGNGEQTFKTTRYPRCFFTSPPRVCSSAFWSFRGEAWTATEAASARSAQSFMVRVVVEDVKGWRE